MQLTLASAASRKQAHEAARLVVVERNRVDIWRLGVAATRLQGEAGPCDREGEALELASSPLLLARMQSSSSLHLVCAAASRDGCWLAVSDAERVRAFRIADSSEDGTAAPEVERVAVPEGLPPVSCLAFSADSAALFAADWQGTIRAVDLEACSIRSSVRLADAGPAAGLGALPPGSASARVGAAGACRRYAPEVSKLVVSPDGGWLAAASGSAVLLYRLPDLTFHGRAATTDDGAPVVAMDFQADGKLLAAANAANVVSVFGVAACAPTQWSLQYRKAVREYLQRLPGNLTGVCFTTSPQVRAGASSSSGGDIVLLYPERHCLIKNLVNKG